MEDQIIRRGEFLVWGILGSAAFLLILKAATGRINLRGLLGTGTGSGISPARVHFLFLTLIGGAFGYLGVEITAISTLPPRCDPEHPCSLPEVPTAILAALGGGSGFYLGAKGLITGGWLDRLRGS